ncbi:MAG: hypothetical protein MHM6MM_000364 [Cercozoa sp. M6MM]
MSLAELFGEDAAKDEREKLLLRSDSESDSDSDSDSSDDEALVKKTPSKAASNAPPKAKAGASTSDFRAADRPEKPFRLPAPFSHLRIQQPTQIPLTTIRLALARNKCVSLKASFSDWKRAAADLPRPGTVAARRKTKPVSLKSTLVGVVVSCKKKTSANGSLFSTLELSDLAEQSTRITCFLHRAAQSRWQEQLKPGLVIALAAPTVVPPRDAKMDRASFSVSDAQQLLVFGPCADFAYCRAVAQRSGLRCRNAVNSSLFEYCDYHARQEHKKYSARRGAATSLGTGTYQGLRGTSSRGKANAPRALNDTEAQLEMKRYLGNRRRPVGQKEMSVDPGRMQEKIRRSDETVRVVGVNGEVRSVLKEDAIREQAALQRSSVARQRLAAKFKALQNGDQSTERVTDRGSTSTPSRSRTAASSKATTPLERKLSKQGFEGGGLTLKLDEPPAATTSVLGKRTQREQPKQASTDIDMSDITGFANESSRAKKLRAAANEKQLKTALGRVSRFARHVSLQQRENILSELDTLAKADRAEQRMQRVTESKVSCVKCLDCGYVQRKPRLLCKSRNHQLAFGKATLHHFFCQDCGRSESCFTKHVTHACRGCGGRRFKSGGGGLHKVRLDITSRSQLSEMKKTSGERFLR